MKVSGPSKTSGARGVSKSGGQNNSGGGFSGMVEQESAVESHAPLSGMTSVSRLDALLSLQEAGDATAEEAGKKGKQRARALLDQLDEIRIGLLTGGIPKSSLQHLTSMINQHRERFMEPGLAEILDEIDLRAQVELAKHSGR
jgi:hypothetical protein